MDVRKIKYGNLTNPTIEILKDIRTIYELGFDFVEIGMEGPEGENEILIRKRKEIVWLLNKFNSKPIAHTAWYMDLGTPNENIRVAWLEEFKRKIKTAHDLGINIVNVHAFSAGMFRGVEKYKKLVLNNFVKSLKESVKYAQKFGTLIILENVPSSDGFSNLKDFKYIVDRVPGLKVHFDIGHAFCNGGIENIKDYLFEFSSKIEHIHIHDNHGNADEHLPLGKGKIDFKKVVELLKGVSYNKTMTFEVFTKDRKDAVRSREYFKKLMKSS